MTRVLGGFGSQRLPVPRGLRFRLDVVFRIPPNLGFRALTTKAGVMGGLVLLLPLGFITSAGFILQVLPVCMGRGSFLHLKDTEVL